MKDADMIGRIRIAAERIEAKRNDPSAQTELHRTQQEIAAEASAWVEELDAAQSEATSQLRHERYAGSDVSADRSKNSFPGISPTDATAVASFLSSVKEHGAGVVAACRRDIEQLPPDARFSPMTVLADALSSTGAVRAIDEQALGTVRFD